MTVAHRLRRTGHFHLNSAAETASNVRHVFPQIRVAPIRMQVKRADTMSCLAA